MPQRSNLFQEVVAIIHAHMAEGATVEESVMLTNRLTGEPREVDVVIRGKTAGHEVLVAVEATAGGRKASAPWVEAMIGKHANLPTDKLVLVCEAGLSKQARRLAESEGIVALTPEDLLADDPTYVVVNQLRSLWPKVISLTPERARIYVSRPGEEDMVWFRALPDHLIFFEDGEEVGPLIAVLRALMEANMASIIEQVGLANIGEDTSTSYELQVGPPWIAQYQGEERTLFVRWEEGGATEFHPIQYIVVGGHAEIQVAEVSLTHRRLGEVMYAYGEGTIAGTPALLLVTESEQGGKATIRFRDETPAA